MVRAVAAGLLPLRSAMGALAEAEAVDEAEMVQAITGLVKMASPVPSILEVEVEAEVLVMVGEAKEVTGDQELPY